MFFGSVTAKEPLYTDGTFGWVTHLRDEKPFTFWPHLLDICNCGHILNGSN